MEEISILLFVIILLLILSLQRTIKKRLDALHSEIQRIREQLAKTIIAPSIPETAAQEKPEIIPSQLVEQVKQKSLTEELNHLLKEATKEESVPGIQEPALPQQPAFVTETISPASNIKQRKRPSFLERNPDLEKFIGENLVSKIGIAILVLAIGFFVKYAIDNEWIGAVGRVGIGILCGAILVTVAHRLRNSYKAFSSVLVGGGLALFYFTVTLAYQQYNLFSQSTAFIIMAVITIFAVALSHLYNRQELAIIALIGGFATPFMVSDGGGNYKTLFWYLIILNSGLLVIAYNKAWRLLNSLAFIFTVVLFGSWLMSLKADVPTLTYRDGFLFATIYYLLFFIINVAYNIRENKKFIASDFGILLANTCAYFAAGLYCLTAMKAPEYRGLFTASLGVFNLAASFALFRNRKIDNNILYLLIGLTLSFISLTAPIQLNGHYITLFWASECALLYWLFQKSKIRIIRLASLIVWAAMIVSLLIDWFNVYGNTSMSLAIILNKGFITTFFAAIASYVLFILKRKETEQTIIRGFYPHSNVFRIAGIVLLFAAGFLEINHQFHHYYQGSDLYILYLLLYTFTFSLLFTLITGSIPSLLSHWYIKTGVLTLCMLIYLLCLHNVFELQKTMLTKHQFMVHFYAHWLGALLAGMILYRLITLLRAHAFTRNNSILLTWVLCIAVVIYLSSEMHLLANNLFYSNENSLTDIRRVYVKTGLPILWGLSSFCFMWLGMRYKFRILRIVSLSLFTLILLKLFMFDIRNITMAGKIAAFFSLGVLLLVVSFMYQRLKKIIIEDKNKPSI